MAAPIACGRKRRFHSRPIRQPEARRARVGLRPGRLDNLHHQLGDGEQPHHDDDRTDPTEQVGRAEGEPRDARHRIGTDRRDHEPEDAREQPLEQRSTGQARDDAQAQHPEGEVGRRREREREARERPRRHDQHREAEQAADEPRHERDAERLAAAALAVHLEAVEHRRRRRVGAGRADQDRGNRAAVLGADVDRREHHDRADRIHAVGERQQQRHRDRRRDPGQCAAHDAPGDAEERRRNGPARRERLPGEGELGHAIQPKRPAGIATPSTRAKMSQRIAAVPTA